MSTNLAGDQNQHDLSNCCCWADHAEPSGDTRSAPLPLGTSRRSGALGFLGAYLPMAALYSIVELQALSENVRAL
jgi:hypothetical protein